MAFSNFEDVTCKFCREGAYMIPGFKPTIETTPSIRPHRTRLDAVWFECATYTVDEINKMIGEMQLAVAIQEKRKRDADEKLAARSGEQVEVEMMLLEMRSPLGIL